MRGDKKLSFRIFMTQGVNEIGCNDWDLVIFLIFQLYKQGNEFISFKNVDGNTVITDGDDNHLVTVDNKQLFSEKVWAIYGDDGKTKYFTIMLPSEY